MTKKERFVWEAFDVFLKVKEVMESVNGVIDPYFDNGFDSGGSDPIIDGNISEYFDFSAAEFGSGITALQQLNNLFRNSAVTPAEYDSSIYKLVYGRKAR